MGRGPFPHEMTTGHPHPAGGQSDDRAALAELLIAVNAAAEVGRAPACRLGLAALASGATIDALMTRLAADSAGDHPLSEGPLLPSEVARAVRRIAASARRRATAERRRAAALGARLVTLLDIDYPAALLDLAMPPPVLYVQGAWPPALLVGRSVAIVGSRRTDAYGREAAGHFARALAAAGLTVVSGCARGVDAAAHRAALAAEGTTVAVLGCGLDVDYPAGHSGLRRDITGAGAVISEFPCGCEPKAWHFPVRNRLIAGLARGTLVIQGAARSGSLITARHALDLGRDVLAVPGSIFDQRSRGTHALLRDGAFPATRPRDVLDALFGPSESDLLLGDVARAATAEAGLPEGIAGRVLATLPRGRECAVEDLALRLGEGVDRILGALLELELAGWARRHPGAAYSRVGG